MSAREVVAMIDSGDLEGALESAALVSNTELRHMVVFLKRQGQMVLAALLALVSGLGDAIDCVFRDLEAEYQQWVSAIWLEHLEPDVAESLV